MSNEEYQVLIRRTGAEARARCVEGASEGDRDEVARAIGGLDDSDVPMVLADLGGHDTVELLRVLDAADADRSRPSVIFAYTVKGWRLPFAGDSMNHSALLSSEQIAGLASTLGADQDDPAAAFPDDSPEGRLCRDRGELLDLRRRSGTRRPLLESGRPLSIEVRVADRTSTQQAFGDTLATLARVPDIGPRVVTATGTERPTAIAPDPPM